MSNDTYSICFEVHRSKTELPVVAVAQQILLNHFGNVAKERFGLPVASNLQTGTVQVDYGQNDITSMKSLIKGAYKDASFQLEAGRIDGFSMTGRIHNESGEIMSRTISQHNLDSI